MPQMLRASYVDELPKQMYVRERQTFNNVAIQYNLLTPKPKGCSDTGNRGKLNATDSIGILYSKKGLGTSMSQARR